MFTQEVTLAYAAEGADMEPTGLYDDHVLKAGAQFRMKYYTECDNLDQLKVLSQHELDTRNIDAIVLSTEQTSNYAVAHCQMNSDAVAPISGIGLGPIVLAVIWGIIAAVTWISIVFIWKGITNFIRAITAFLDKIPFGIGWFVVGILGLVGVFIVIRGLTSKPKEANPRKLKHTDASRLKRGH